MFTWEILLPVILSAYRCHPERSEGSHEILRAKAIRMTMIVILSAAKDLIRLFESKVSDDTVFANNLIVMIIILVKIFFVNL